MVTAEYVVRLEGEKKLKMLKRHLMTAYNMTSEDCRARWGLKANHTIVGPNYAKKRLEPAKKIGLGRKLRRGTGAYAGTRGHAVARVAGPNPIF